MLIYLGAGIIIIRPGRAALTRIRMKKIFIQAQMNYPPIVQNCPGASTRWILSTRQDWAPIWRICSLFVSCAEIDFIGILCCAWVYGTSMLHKFSSWNPQGNTAMRPTKLEIMTNENSRPLVGPEATPSVRLRRRQESYLGMVKSPFLTWPSVRP